MFGTVNTSQSCLIVQAHAWKMEADDEMQEDGTIEVQFNHRDGSPHHWRFYSPSRGEEHWSHDSGDRPRLREGQHPNFDDSEVRELDTPDVVFEVVCSLSAGLGHLMPGKPFIKVRK